MIEKAKLGFTAIAVVAAINLKGEVVSYLIKDKTICRDDFVEFLDKLRVHMKRRKTYIMLDNLRLHYTEAVESTARRNN